MRLYKGFRLEPDGRMTCNGYEFRQGETYETDRAELCKCGFHACEDPIDCYSYYLPGNSVYHVVELDGVTDETSTDSKRVGTKITIGDRLTPFEIARLHFEYVQERAEHKSTSDDARSAASTQGYGSAASTQGVRSAASTQGDWSAASTQGYGSAAVSLGYKSTASACLGSVAVAFGKDTAAQGKVGSYLVLSEWGDWDGTMFPLFSASMVYVDGDKIKEDTWYSLVNGEVVAVANPIEGENNG